MNPPNFNTHAFQKELDARIAKHDLLCHPFYQAWTQGRLTRDDLRSYAVQYFHQVAAFPEYLEMFESRLAAGSPLAEAVARNRAEEEGADSEDGRAHAELWLDFAEGMGAERSALASSAPLPEIQELVDAFQSIAREGSPAEALAAFYAYESQVPRIAAEKARGLKEMYGADQRTCGYFTVHQTADVYHAQVWSQQLGKQLQTASPALQENDDHQKALDAAEKIAQALWRALDGIERERMARAA
jgi:pyrroloquinoline-quinone synthase